MIDATKEFHYVYSYQSSKRSTLRAKSEIIDAANVNPDHPLRISVRYDRGSTNWHIPFRYLIINSHRHNFILDY